MGEESQNNSAFEGWAFQWYTCFDDIESRNDKNSILLLKKIKAEFKRPEKRRYDNKLFQGKSFAGVKIPPATAICKHTNLICWFL